MTINDTLEDLLSVESSRRSSDLVADIILQKPELFGELASIFFRDEEPVSRRAVWVMDIVSEKKPELILPYLEEIARRLPEFSHDGMKRESLKILSRSPLVKTQFGPLMNTCFIWLVSPEESVGIKMFSMMILFRMSEIEPDLKHELAASIEWRMEEEKPGFRSRGRKLLEKLRKETSRI
jgi:hypothetical protein